jgi:hypothetical protein
MRLGEEFEGHDAVEPLVASQYRRLSFFCVGERKKNRTAKLNQKINPEVLYRW